MARVLIRDQAGNELCKLDARYSDIRDSEHYTADIPLTNGDVEYVVIRHGGRKYIGGVYTKKSREASEARTAFYAALNVAIEFARGDNPR